MRISVTTLESFRLWRDYSWKPEAELIATIKGQFEPTPRVLLGRAYGRVLEAPDVYRTDAGYECGHYRFERDAIDPALAAIDARAAAAGCPDRGLFEVKATRRYGAHTVVAKADHVAGAVVDEFKTRVGSYHIDRYLESYQWRLMADLFQPAWLEYLVFVLTEAPVALVDVQSSGRLFPYPRLHDDCHALVEEFVAYVYRRDLAAWLPDVVEPVLPPTRAVVDLMAGPAFVDAPTRAARPAPRHLRELRRPQIVRLDIGAAPRPRVPAMREGRLF